MPAIVKNNGICCPVESDQPVSGIHEDEAKWNLLWNKFGNDEAHCHAEHPAEQDDGHQNKQRLQNVIADVRIRHFAALQPQKDDGITENCGQRECQ